MSIIFTKTINIRKIFGFNYIVTNILNYNLFLKLEGITKGFETL